MEVLEKMGEGVRLMCSDLFSREVESYLREKTYMWYEGMREHV